MTEILKVDAHPSHHRGLLFKAGKCGAERRTFSQKSSRFMVEAVSGSHVVKQSQAGNEPKEGQK